MSALDHNPISTNLQAVDWFKFDIKRAPSLSYFCQTVKLPNIQSEPAIQKTPFIDIPIPGDQIEFQPLSVSFRVDDNFQNWLELHNWMLAITNTLGKSKERIVVENNPQYTGYGIKSELTLYCLNSQKVPSLVFIFHDAFPIALGGLDFDTQVTGDVQYVQAMASFAYTYYESRLP